MKKILSVLLAVLMLAMCFASCTKPEDKDTSTLDVCLASEPDTLDPALNSAVDGATMIVHLFSGLATWTQNADGTFVISADCAAELPKGTKNDDGTVTYTYTLKDGLKWSNGDALTAEDFVFSWNRAASAALGADYGYMFDVIKGYADVAEGVSGAKLAVEAVDAKTLKVTLSNDVPYWNELLAFPTYYPVHKATVANEKWATDPSTYVCNGAYTMKAWEHNSVITLEKNANYHSANKVTMDTIKCHLSDDANNMLANFKNGAWQLIDDVPTNEIAGLKSNSEFVIAGQIGTYYVSWNINENILPEGSTLTGVEAEKAQQEIRKAVSLFIDRNYVVESVSQAGELPASTFVPMGISDADKSDFYKNANPSATDYDGYYNVDKNAYAANVAAAKETLAKYYDNNFPSLEYIYNTNDGHKAIAEYLQGAFKSAGITMNLTNQEWNTFLNTRKEGDYSVARNGWVADFNDPISFLDMWISTSGNNDVQFGKGAHANLEMYNLDLTKYGYDIKVENGTWAETYDVLIATIKACSDTEKRYAMMHVAEDMIMDTGCITPIYYYTDLYMIDDSVEGFYSIPLGYKYFMYTTIKDAE